RSKTKKGTKKANREDITLNKKKANCAKAKDARDTAIEDGLLKKAKDWVINSGTGTDDTTSSTDCVTTLYKFYHPTTAQAQKNPRPTKRVVTENCDKAISVLSRNKTKESGQATSSDDSKFKGDECAAVVRAAMREGGKCEGMSIQACTDKYGCSSSISTIETTQVTGQLTAQGVQVISQATSAVATASVQATAQQANSGAPGTSSDDVHKKALESMASAQDAAAVTQGVGAAALTSIAVVETVVATRQSRTAKEVEGGLDVLLTHNKLVKEYIADPTDENYQRVATDFSTNIGTDNADARTYLNKEKNANADPILMTFDEDKIRTQLGVKKALATKAMGQAAQHYVQAGVLAVGAAVNEAEANALREAARAIGNDVSTGGPAAPAFVTTVAGGPTSSLADTNSPNTGVTQTLGDAQSAATAEQTGPSGSAPAGAIPPPLFGGGSNPGGLKDAGPGVSGGMAGVGSSSGGGGQASGGGGSGGGGGDSGGGDAKAGDETVGGKTKFEGAAAGAGGFAGPGSNGVRDKNTGMNGLEGLLAGLQPGAKDDRKPASDIVEFGKDKAAAKAQAQSDEEQGIMGPNSNLFKRVSNTTVSYYKVGKLK
ncbi:MAG: hypothetical protein HY074_16545, partial [Deltaproteobacteria bacterium]|nr:hypothetical protein [Deltaproteobacteria bacterium]